MKSTSCALLALALSLGSAFAAELVTKSVLTFSTPGPDVYADGTPIADGERYYLVFVPTGIETWSVTNTGEIEGGAKFVAQSFAKNGACFPNNVNFDISDPTYSDGLFQIVALDTRSDNGTPGSGYVYSYGVAGEIPGVKAGSVTLAGTEAQVGGMTINAMPVLPPGFKSPVITGLKIENGQAVISAAAADGSRYSIETSDSLTGEWKKAENTSSFSSSALNAEGGIAIPVDPAKSRQFFKIVRGE